MERTIKRIADLSVQSSHVDYVDSSAFYANDNAHDWVVKTFNDNLPVTLTGSVEAVVQRPDGTWVTGMAGIISGNIVSVTLTAECYKQVGQILCMMIYTEGSTKLVLDVFYTRVQAGYAAPAWLESE